MCGIHLIIETILEDEENNKLRSLSLSQTTDHDNETTKSFVIQPWLYRRGPDHVGTYVGLYNDTNDDPIYEMKKERTHNNHDDHNHNHNDDNLIDSFTTTNRNNMDDQLYRNDSNNDDQQMMNIRNENNDNCHYYRILFHASVLAMRNQIIKQPYTITSSSQFNNFSTPNIHHHYSNEINNNNNQDTTINNSNNNIENNVNNNNNNIGFQFAWNGEVYQFITKTTNIKKQNNNNNHVQINDDNENDSNDTDDDNETEYEYHNVWDPNISDTELVASMIQKHIVDKLNDLYHVNNNIDDNDNGKYNSHDIHNNDGKIINNDNDDDSSNSTKQQTKKHSTIQYFILKQLQMIMSYIVNTEYSFCLYSKYGIYYGRDTFGRRSLLIKEGRSQQRKISCHTNNSTTSHEIIHQWQLSSVAISTTSTNHDNDSKDCNAVVNDDWIEVQPGIIFCYDWKTKHTISCPIDQKYYHYPNHNSIVHSISSYQQQDHHTNLDFDYYDYHPNTKIHSIEQASIYLEQLLLNAVRYRLGQHHVNNKDDAYDNDDNTMSILFSGGLDSTVLAAMVLKLVSYHTKVQLINISFVDKNNDNDKNDNKNHQIGNISNNNSDDNESSTIKTTMNQKKNRRRKKEKKDNVTNTTAYNTTAADTIAAIESYNELQKVFPNHNNIHFIQYVANWDNIQQCEMHVRQLIYPKSTIMDINISIALWLAASQINNDNDNSNDDTITVTHTTSTATTHMNNTLTEYQQQQPITMTTTSTEAVNMTGTKTNHKKKKKNRILLTGLGADELMGGYGRHKKAWEKENTVLIQKSRQQNIDDHGSTINTLPNNTKDHSNDNKNDSIKMNDDDNYNNMNEKCYQYQLLRSELDYDIKRLWERNLGRDDRILCDHSIEVRLPFLDVHVVHFLQNICPLQYIVQYQQHDHEKTMKQKQKDDDDELSKHHYHREDIPGDKAILRLIAYRYELYTASFATKRAIQFGSRIAHVSDKRRFGSRRKATGEKNM